MIHQVDDDVDDAFEPKAKRIKLSDTNVAVESSPFDSTHDLYGAYLRDLHLKKIVRENHGHDISSMIFNPLRPFVSNLLASVGGSQANIYDNANCGSHLDLIENFVHRDTQFFVSLAEVDPTLAPVPSSRAQPMAPPAPKPKKGTKKSGTTNLGWNLEDIDSSRRELRACCWLRGPSVSAQLTGRPLSDDDDLFEECWLAIAGTDQIVHLLSSSKSKIVQMLFGCTSPVFALASDASGRRIAAITKNSQLCVWNLNNLIDHISTVEYQPPRTVEEVLATPGCRPVLDADVPEGIICLQWIENVGLLMGSKSGLAYCIPVDDSGDLISPVAMVTIQTPHKGALGDIEYLMLWPQNQSSKPSSSLKQPKPVISKSSDGRVFIWSAPNREIMTKWAQETPDKVLNVDLWPGSLEGLRIPNCFGTATEPVIFDVTPDGRYIAAGTSKGQVYIFDLLSGAKIATLEHKRLSQPIPSVQFAKPDCKSVLFCSSTFIWRYDFIDPEELKLLREQNNAAAVAADES